MTVVVSFMVIPCLSQARHVRRIRRMIQVFVNSPIFVSTSARLFERSCLMLSKRS